MQRIVAFLEKYKIINSGKSFLVGFSGGYDSMCLLDILHKFSAEYNFKIIAAHLNHNWRGKEADQEEENCRLFCNARGIEFYTEKLSKDIKKSETVAREARQKFFRDCCKKFQADGVFLAHNKSDNTETVLYRIAYGTGVKGLCGINEYCDSFGYKIFRPLLSWSRKEIECYCKDHSLYPNNDSSNADIKYKRNFIRHKVKKDLEEINPNLDDTVFRLSRIAEAEQNIIKEYLDNIRQEICDGRKINTKKFLSLSTNVQNKFIHELFIEKNLEYDSKKICEVVCFIAENANLACGKTMSISKNLWFFVSKNYFSFIEKKEKVEEEIFVEKEGLFCFGNKVFEVKKIEQMPEKFPKENENYAIVHLEFPLMLRTRRDGDIINPFGMKGCMKLKKYFINKNIEKYIRDEIVLLCNEKEVLWVPEIGLSEKLRVKNRKAPVYIISMKER